MPTQYVIKDLERLSGIKAHTLRIWEQRYNILKPERTDTNIRYYTSEDLKRILNISLLNNHGLKISKIAKLPDVEIVKQATLILDGFEKEGDQVSNLLVCLMEINEDKFEKVISECILHFGFQSTIEKVMFPFLVKTGDMWQLGIINPAQEHFITNLVRQKIIVAIDQLRVEPIIDSKTFILYLPENEMHELGLLYCHYLVKSKGHKCLYLGQSVPFEDLLAVSKIIHPDVLMFSITSQMADITVREYLNNLAVNFKKSRIIASGRIFFEGNIHVELPKNVILVDSHEQFRNVL